MLIRKSRIPNCDECLISIFEQTNGTIMTLLLLVHLDLGLACAKVRRLSEYTHVRYFNNFVQAAADARCQRDENPNSSVVAESMTSLTNIVWLSEVGSQSHSVTRYMNDEKKHASINT